MPSRAISCALVPAERASCAPGPWGNTIYGNMAVNASGTSAVALQLTQFPVSRFNYSTEANRLYNASSDASLMFVKRDPAAARCYQLEEGSPLYAGGFFQRIPMDRMGTPEWQSAWPCA